MFGFGKKPAPPVAEVKPQGGAAAFIADVNKVATDRVAAMEARQATQIARVKAALAEIMFEEQPFAAADGVPEEHVIHAALGAALGAAAAAMGEVFNQHKPPCAPGTEPGHVMLTVNSLANVFLSKVRL